MAPLSMEQFDWPYFALTDNVLACLPDWCQRSERLALATLVARTGSSPQPVGSQMLVSDTGEVAGYVSGGCVESNLALIAEEVIAAETPRIVAFGKDSEFVDINLPCGTRIEVAVEPFRTDDPIIGQMAAHVADRVPGLLLSDIESGERHFLTLERTDVLPEAANAEPLVARVRAAVGNRRLPAAGLSGTLYWKVFEPVPRLILNGGDPVALSLALHARLNGLEVVINRQDGPAADVGEKGIRYTRRSAESLFEETPPNAWTAVVSTTHDLDVDHAYLCPALKSPAFYVGVLGSRNHMPERRARFEAAGLTPEDYARLSAPVGLDIGAVGPNEIAISILADIIRAWRNR